MNGHQTCPDCGREICLYARYGIPMVLTKHDFYPHKCVPNDLLTAAKDALQCLRRLLDVDGAYRVTCIGQLVNAIAKAEERNA